MRRLVCLLAFLLAAFYVPSYCQNSQAVPDATYPPYGLPGSCSTPQHTVMLACFGEYDCSDQIDITTPSYPHTACEPPEPQTVLCCGQPYTVWVRSEVVGACHWASLDMRRDLSTLAKSRRAPSLLVPNCLGEFEPLEEFPL